MSFDNLSADYAQGPSGGAADPLDAAIDARERDIVKMVQQAIDEDNIMMAFQPIVPTGRQDRPAFYEGLVRVLNDSGRIIPAKDFILQIEERALGREIDCLSLRHGVETLRRRSRLRLAINMSARSIGHDAWLEILERGLHADPTLGERLILEITESSAITDPEAVARFIKDYQRRGLSFAIDDFGAGYTSMGYLKDLYFDILKIDGQFIRGIADSADNQALVKAMVAIGRHFDMVTIAEQVENLRDAEMLEEVGVDCLQGYYFGAPTIRPRWEPCSAGSQSG